MLEKLRGGRQKAVLAVWCWDGEEGASLLLAPSAAPRPSRTALWWTATLRTVAGDAECSGDHGNPLPRLSDSCRDGKRVAGPRLTEKLGRQAVRPTENQAVALKHF